MVENQARPMLRTLALMLPSRRRASGSQDWTEPSRWVVFAGVGEASALAAFVFMDLLAQWVGGHDAVLALVGPEDDAGIAMRSIVHPNVCRPGR